MQEIKISKGGGKYRTVYSPNAKERQRLGMLLPVLQQAERKAAALAGVESVAHGFVAGRSPVTAALLHIGYQVTVSVDLSSWFDTVTPAQIALGLESAEVKPDTMLPSHFHLHSYRTPGDRNRLRYLVMAEQVCYLGAPRQGLPTSPSAANLAAIPMDRAILDSLAKLPCKAVYTRYADDLTVSLAVDSPGLVQSVLLALGAATAAMGWTLAKHKTSIQHARAGRRVIVGVSVGETDIQAPKKMRRRLRAAKYQLAKCNLPYPEVTKPGRHVKGLTEWCAMRLPKAIRPNRQIAGVNSAGVQRTEKATAEEAIKTTTLKSGQRRIVINQNHAHQPEEPLE